MLLESHRDRKTARSHPVGENLARVQKKRATRNVVCVADWTNCHEWDFKNCRQNILELNSPSEQSHAKLPIHTIHTIHTPVQTDVPIITVQALNDSSANSDRMC